MSTTLLQKYMRLVLNEEGVTFLHLPKPEYISAEEWAELIEVELQLNKEM